MIVHQRRPLTERFGKIGGVAGGALLLEQRGAVRRGFAAGRDICAGATSTIDIALQNAQPDGEYRMSCFHGQDR